MARCRLSRVMRADLARLGRSLCDPVEIDGGHGRYLSASQIASADIGARHEEREPVCAHDVVGNDLGVAGSGFPSRKTV